MHKRELVTLLFRHRRWMLTVFAVVVSSVALASLLTAPVYEAKSRLLVKFGREYVEREVSPSQWPQGRGDVLNSEIGILTSRQLIEQVIAGIGLWRIYPEVTAGQAEASTPAPTAVNAAIEKFTQHLVATPVRDSNIVDATFRHPDPQVAAEALDALLRAFRDKRLEIWSDPRAGFLEHQVQASQQRLQRTASRLEAFRQKHRVFSLPDQRRLLLEARAELQAGLLGTESQRQALERKTAALREQLNEVTDTVPLFDETERNVVTDDAHTRLLALRLKEKELRAKYRDDHRLLADVRTEIETVERFLGRQSDQRRVRVGRNELHDQLSSEAIRTDADRHAHDAKVGATAAQVAGIEAALRELDLHANELEALTRDLSIAENDYRRSVERLEEARVATRLDKDKVDSVRIVEAPAVPTRPIWPRTGLNIGIAAVVGALAAVATAYLRDRVQRTFALPETVEREVGVRVLATVPRR